MQQTGPKKGSQSKKESEKECKKFTIFFSHAHPSRTNANKILISPMVYFLNTKNTFSLKVSGR